MTAEGFESGSFIMKDKAFLALPFKKTKKKHKIASAMGKKKFLEVNMTEINLVQTFLALIQFKPLQIKCVCSGGGRQQMRWGGGRSPPTWQ